MADYCNGLSCFVCNSSENSGCLDKNFKEYSQSTLAKQFCMVSNARFCIKTTALYGGNTVKNSESGDRAENSPNAKLM
ncbi:unnamed protein product [Schistocephalus solidus]|uniref:Uncharacterized protein n=1 Tax=Schistocephalus solidus TaxID=70667 RepID=A0A183SLF0_SCHSO|nr:unnamed protein product [Schistocephalus solidus]